MMLLLLDVGNSRLKWGFHDGRQWLANGVTPNQDIGRLAFKEWQSVPRPTRVVGVNVGGEAVRVRVEAQLARWRLQPQWFLSSNEACGLRNRYQRPDQLGADRWAALIGAWQRAQRSCLVVNAGTAITVDAIDANGTFLGGVIIPGLQMMRRALADNTAALRVAAGSYRDFPTHTEDAVWTGALEAAVGAIQRMREKLSGEGEASPCIVSGGAADEVAPLLPPPVSVVEQLVLEGLLAWTQEKK